jgi:hypothetical protein
MPTLAVAVPDPGPGGLVVGDGAEGLDRPRRCFLGGMLAEALLAAVHHGGDLGQVRLPLWVGEFGDAARPGTLGLGERLATLSLRERQSDPGLAVGRSFRGS